MNSVADAEKILLRVVLTKCVPHRNIQIEAGKGERLSEVLWLSGKLAVSALCSGLGHCGACKVRFLSGAPEATQDEIADLGREAVADGWRLSCKHSVHADAWLSVDAEPFEEKKSRGVSDSGSERIVLGVDLGTTSIQWRAIHPDGRTCAEGDLLNPQLAAGCDVMSRIAMACTERGVTRLRAPVIRVLRRIVKRFPGGVGEICVAGNSAMTAILAGKMCTELSAAPYRLAEEGGHAIHIEDLPPIWLPNQISPFVGGDVSSGMIWLLEQKPQFPFLLADMGTNGEFVLALDKENALAVSVPLGPALEGIGLSCGTNAAPGSIVGFDIAPEGLKCRFWENENSVSRAVGISGTGYLSLLALLLREGVLLADGQPAGNAVSPLARRLLALLRRDGIGSWRFDLPHGMCLTAHDVEAVLKVRAAFAMAAGRLMRAARLRPENMDWYLAGALGWHAPRTALERLGFIPAGLGDKVRAIGNASLNGAVFLLCRPELRERLRKWKQGCAVLELTSLPDAENLYIKEMRFHAMRGC